MKSIADLDWMNVKQVGWDKLIQGRKQNRIELQGLGKWLIDFSAHLSILFEKYEKNEINYFTLRKQIKIFLENDIAYFKSQQSYDLVGCYRLVPEEARQYILEYNL